MLKPFMYNTRNHCWNLENLWCNLISDTNKSVYRDHYESSSQNVNFYKKSPMHQKFNIIVKQFMKMAGSCKSTVMQNASKLESTKNWNKHDQHISNRIRLCSRNEVNPGIFFFFFLRASSTDISCTTLQFMHNRQP